MSNDDYRRTSDDAYDDLMDSYFNQGRSKGTNRASGSSNQKPFKLNIKDLDSEFNTGSSGKNSSQPVKRYTPVNSSRSNTSRSGSSGRQPVKKTAAKGSTSKGASVGGAQISKRGSGAIIAKKNRRKPKFNLKQYLLKKKTAIIVFLICVAVAVSISTYTLSCVNDILAMNRDSEQVIIVNLPAEVDTNKAIDILKDNKLIKHPEFCKVFAKFMKYRDDNYLTGLYYLTESMGLENMLASFKRPTNTGETVYLTFPEGYNVNQIAEKLEKYGVCSAQNFYTTIEQIDFSSEYSFVKNVDRAQDRYKILEGYLYPDTYEFYLNENPAAVVRKFLNNFKDKWTDEYQAQADKLGMSMDDVITLASIIEKEAYGDEQMAQVSSVLHNRLNNSGLYPRLECDSTNKYVEEYISKNVQDAVTLSRLTQNYSTYKCQGLPVGAICNPGDAAIQAALKPADTGYYFFSHDKNHKIYLAANDSERRANDRLRANADAASGDDNNVE